MDNQTIQFNNYLKAEKKYIEDAKWFEGINTNKDPGDKFILNWIQKHAKEFREKWMKTECQYCVKAGICGDQLKVKCKESIRYE